MYEEVHKVCKNKVISCYNSYSGSLPLSSICPQTPCCNILTWLRGIVAMDTVPLLIICLDVLAVMYVTGLDVLPVVLVAVRASASPWFPHMSSPGGML